MSQTVTFERFSDSASAYVKLDSDNPAVYKQLYRAAKAKLKLRIRAVIANNPTVAAPGSAPPVPPFCEKQPEHQLTPYCYVPPADAEALKVNAFEKLMRTPSYCLAPVPQNSTGGCLQQTPYPYPTAPALVPVSSSKEAFAESLGLNIPKAEAKKTVNEGAPIPRSLSPRREDFYAELASLSSKDSKATLHNPIPPFSAIGTSFTICCNSCDGPIPNNHYHCSKCDDGDFDLCEACYNKSIRCNGDDHWLVKRGVKDGRVTSSSTETIAPRKPIASYFDVKNESPLSEPKEVPGAFTQEIKEAFQQPLDLSRTCNSCVARKYCAGGHVRSMLTATEYDESNFVTCTECDDYDLCIACHVGNRHGHHPGHAFMPASEQTTLNTLASKLLSPGRNAHHAAICDGCDKVCQPIASQCSPLTVSRMSLEFATSA